MTDRPNKVVEDDEAPFRFGPWKKGLNTLQQDSELDPDELRFASNVDITNDGHLRRRRGSYQAYAGTNVHSVGIDLLFAEGSSLKRFNPATSSASTLKSGITPMLPIVYEEVNDWIYWTNGIDSGKVDGTYTNYPWGLQVPNAPVGTAGGGGILVAGRYQLCLSYSHTNGEESGTGLAAIVDVATNGSITVALNQPQSGQGIATINIFVSAPNGEVMYFHGSVATGTTTYMIQSVELTTREARNRFLTAPPAGKILTSRFGRMYIASGNVVYWTEPFAYSLFDPMRNYAVFDSEVKVMRAVSNGLWIVTAYGTFWMPGDNPNQAHLQQQAEYSAPLQTAIDIPDTNSVAWLSYRGWVIGTQDGQLQNLSDQRVGVNQSGQRVITLYREKNGIRQFVGLVSGSLEPSVNSEDYLDAESPNTNFLFESGDEYTFESSDYRMLEA
jgi:hypothetical protein